MVNEREDEGRKDLQTSVPIASSTVATAVTTDITYHPQIFVLLNRCRS